MNKITPRKDEKDKSVIECNNLLVSLYEKEPYVFLVDHDNLRDENYSMYFDNKHIHRRAIPLFAANIKKSLRKAYEIAYEKPKYTKTHKTRHDPERLHHEETITQ